MADNGEERKVGQQQLRRRDERRRIVEMFRLYFAGCDTSEAVAEGEEGKTEETDLGYWCSILFIIVCSWWAVGEEGVLKVW